MDEVGLAGYFFFGIIFSAEIKILSIDTQGAIDNIYQLTVNLDLLHTLSILPFPLSCPVSSLLSHSLAISPNPSLSLPCPCQCMLEVFKCGLKPD